MTAVHGTFETFLKDFLCVDSAHPHENNEASDLGEEKEHIIVARREKENKDVFSFPWD